MRTSLIISSVLAVSCASLASAAITGVSGVYWFLSSPVNAQQSNLGGPLPLAWNEQANVSSAALPVNLTAPGTYTGPTMNFGTITGSFDSHMIHYDLFNPVSVSGSVTFSGSIIAVIYDEKWLSASDATLGSLGTLYDTGNILRSFNGNVLGASTITYSGSTLSFNFVRGSVYQMFELRVLTHSAPAPGAAGLLAMTGLVGTHRRRVG